MDSKQIYSPTGINIEDLLDTEHKKITEIQDTGIYPGLKTPWANVNNIIPNNKIEWGTLLTIAAGSGTGKTTFILQMMMEAMTGDNTIVEPDKDYKIIFFSYEMTTKQLYSKMIMYKAGLKYEDLYKKENKLLVQQTTESLKKNLDRKILVYKQPLGINDMVLIIKKLYDKHNYKYKPIIFIDYLTIIPKYSSNENLEVANVMMGLTNIKNYTDGIVVLLSQLNKQYTSDIVKTYRHPTSNDLIGSSMVTNSSDMIWLLSSPHKVIDKLNFEKRVLPTDKYMWLITDKNRMKGLQTTVLKKDLEHSRFLPYVTQENLL